MVPELRGIIRTGLRPLGTALLLATLLASCNTTKYLTGGQELLTSQRVKMKAPKEMPNKADVAYELSTIAQQQPNGNFLFLWPREYFYFDNNKPKDTTRIDRFLRNTIGQRPAIYSDSLSRRSAKDMAAYLLYQGYFNARAYHEADRGKKRKVNLIYHVEPGHRYLIDSVQYTSQDPRLDSLLQAAKEESLLVKGAPLDLNNFDQEKVRLGRYFRNHGYAFFTSSYLDKLEIDTTRRQGYADVFLSILPAPRADAYDRYKVGSITVLADFSPLDAQSGRARLDTIIDNVRFLTGESAFRMRPELLRRSIFLRPGDYYNQEEREKTTLALNGLGIYRFVRINQQIDSLGEKVLNYQIQLSPSDRMSIGADLDFSYTNRNGNIGAGNLLGVSVSPNFSNRNLLGGAELLVTNFRAGVEINPFPSDTFPFLSTVDLAVDVSLYLPRFKDFGLYSLLNKLPAPWKGNLISDTFIAQLREKASTRYSLGYEYLLISQFYSYTILNARLGYDFRRSTTTNYRINHLAIDVLVPSTEQRFKEILDQNQFLQRSFGEQYFFSALFRDLQYTHSGRPDQRGRSLSFTGAFELAGAEVFLTNQLFDAGNTWTPKDGATYAKYVSGLADISYNKQYTAQHSFAARFLISAARPFGGSATEDAAVPYVKQFFVGGANSMRAWAPRGLGPGGYVDPLSLNTDNNLRLFQTGDFRMELNLEYRFPITTLFKGAFFADIGNIWTFEEDADQERPGSQFLLGQKLRNNNTFLHQPFYRQLAIGMGTGLRVDLSYFVFRLDASIPMRYNYPQDGFGNPLDRDNTKPPEGDYWRSFQRFRLRDITFQLGLGYPF